MNKIFHIDYDLLEDAFRLNQSLAGSEIRSASENRAWLCMGGETSKAMAFDNTIFMSH